MDLADQIDEYICSFEGIGDLTMDSLAIFIFIWAILSLFVVWLCKFLYNKYFINANKSASNANSRQSSVAPGIRSEKRLSEPRELSSTKSDIKDLLSKPHGARGPVNAAPLRRRVVRQSSTGPENRKKRYIPPPSSVVGPESTSVTWTSQVFRWLYSDLVIVNELLMGWVISLNDTLRKAVEENATVIEIIRVLPDSPPPGLSNIFCNSEEHNPSEMVVSFDCDAMPVFQVKASRQKSGKLETSHYKVTVSRLRGRVACAINYNSLRGELRIEGYPDIRINMNSVGAIKPMDSEEQLFQSQLSERLGNALRDTIYPVDFSIYSTCPRAEQDLMNIPVIYPMQYDPYASDVDSRLQLNQQMVSGRRLLVKIVKGEELNHAKDPFVIVEMDEPAQKNQTGTKLGSNPLWDEHFLFELSSKSAEILFEVYDRISPTQDNFLGLGLVGIDEIAIGLSSTQKLVLQPRPYETQEVSGSITVDFIFIEGAEIPISNKSMNVKEAVRLSTPLINEHIKNGGDVADAAVRALQDRASSSSANPSKSTLIIHSVQKNPTNPHAFKVELNNAGEIEMTALEDNNDERKQTLNTMFSESSGYQEFKEKDSGFSTDKVFNTLNANDINNASIITNNLQNSTGNNASLQEDSNGEFGKPIAASSPNGFHNNYDIQNVNGNVGQHSQKNSNRIATNGNNMINEPDFDNRGRSKKRNFFGTLKKRLSRSKTRTHSAENDKNKLQTQIGSLNGDSRSLSVDRVIPNSVGNRNSFNSTLNHSRRSSISESSAISGFSSASTKTYVHEASTLVLETIENGIKRHFIVPLAIAQRPRWRRKGTKLHIYNDHTFVAKHLSGSGLQCSICMKSIPRRPGKQGYECRDCNLICHKQCHVRAPQACPNPTILSMELCRLNSSMAEKSIRKA